LSFQKCGLKVPKKCVGWNFIAKNKWHLLRLTHCTSVFVTSTKELAKLTPAVNFINILRAAFMCTDPKSAKRTDDLIVIFVLSGSACVKAVCKMLLKSTPDLLTI